MPRHCLALVLTCLLVATSLSGTRARAEEEGEVQQTTSYVRLAEEAERLGLEVAIRKMLPAEDSAAPAVYLVGVIHIADLAYYDAVENALLEHRLVLYEGVLPPGAGRIRTDSSELRVTDTKARLAFLARSVRGLLTRGQAVPASRDALLAAAATLDPRFAHALDIARLDAWGRPIRYERFAFGDDEGFRFTSYGADGAPGGEGEAADMTEGERKDVAAPQGLDKEPFNLQARLAEALGLSYQGEGVDYGHDGWRPSDLAIDELRRAVVKRGGNLDRVEDLLAGRGIKGFLIRIYLGLLKFADRLMGGDVKLAIRASLVTALGNQPAEIEPDDVFDEPMLRAIIDDRNEAVMADLDDVLARPGRPATIAIFYGAGHMPDFERRLAERGYRPGPMRWLRAIDVDLAAMTPRAKRIFESVEKQRRDK